MLLCFFLRAEESKKLCRAQSLRFVKASKPERGDGGLATLLQILSGDRKKMNKEGGCDPAGRYPAKKVCRT